MALALMSACGGGSGSGTVDSRTFALQTIYENYISAAHSYNIAGSGAAINQTPPTFDVAASITESALAGPITFGSNTTASWVDENYLAAGDAPQNQVTIRRYYNAAKQLIGVDSPAGGLLQVPGRFVLSGSPSGFPQSAKIGDVGQVWPMVVYASSDTSQPTVGTATGYWSLKAGTGSYVALFEQTLVVEVDPLKVTLTNQYAIDNNNVAKLSAANVKVEYRTLGLWTQVGSGQVTYTSVP